MESRSTLTFTYSYILYFALFRELHFNYKCENISDIELFIATKTYTFSTQKVIGISILIVSKLTNIK